MICQVCGDPSDAVVGVACVPGVPYSAAHRRRCLEEDAHPYFVLRAAAAGVADTAFLRAAGGSKHHHVYPGGLIEHTLQVTQVALSLGRLLGADQQVLAIAALWHDYGKIFDYQIAEDGRVTDTPHRKLINHLSRSAIEFMLACQAILHYEDLKEAVLHCILSYHGRREWGSPVEPGSPYFALRRYAEQPISIHQGERK